MTWPLRKTALRYRRVTACVLHMASLAASLESIDSTLSSFSIDDLPYFSRTVLASSPILLVLHIESGNAVPLGSLPAYPGATPTASRHSSSRAAGASNADDEPELPEILQKLLRVHKRATYNLFLRWEQNGQREVPLNSLAEGVRLITGTRLSDDDLLSVLQCVEPVRGDEVSLDPNWRKRPIDCNRLWRRLQRSAARLASKYLKQTAHPEHGAPPHKGPGPDPVKVASGIFETHDKKRQSSSSNLARGTQPGALFSMPSMNMMLRTPRTDARPVV